MQQGAIPENDPRLLTRAILGLYNSIWHWYRPNGIVALDRIAEFFTERSLALIGVAPEAAARARVGGMTFFERYFDALDGPDPHSSLELVADDVEFSIQWARGADRKSRQFVGGREELRRFIDAGDTSGWAHHVLFERRRRATSSSRSARRATTDGERIGTFLAVAQLDGDGRMRALHGRPLAGDRVRAGAGRCRLSFARSPTA